MPIPENIKLQASVNGGAPQLGPVEVESEDEVVLSLVRNTGVSSARYTIYEYPEGFECPDGWTDDSGIYYVVTNGSAAPAITVPDPEFWGKFFCAAEANDRKRNGELVADLYTELGFQLRHSSGLEDIGFGETNQFDSVRAWAGSLKRNTRAIAEIAGSGNVPLSGFSVLARATTGTGLGTAVPIGESEVIGRDEDGNVTSTKVKSEMIGFAAVTSPAIASQAVKTAHIDDKTITAPLVDDDAAGYATMAALRLVAPLSGRIVETRSHTTKGDGRGGFWRGVTGASPGTYTHDGYLYIVPSDGDGSAAWLRADVGMNLARSDVFLGPAAGLLLDGVTSQYNVCVGTSAGRNITSGSKNTFVGHNGGSGDAALAPSIPGLTGTDNVGIGYHAVKKLQTGIHNVGVGVDALNECTTGNNNTALGGSALQEIVTGSDNVGVGRSAGLRANGAASRNTVIGRDAGRLMGEATDNTIVGYRACRGTNVDDASHMTGTGNVVIGKDAMYTNPTTASDNVAIGREAGKSVSTGTGNVFIGCEAGRDNVDGSNNIVIGNAAHRAVASESNKLVIANQSAVAFIEGDMVGSNHASNLLTVDAGIRAGADNTRNLGTSSRAWATAYVNRLQLSAFTVAGPPPSASSNSGAKIRITDGDFGLPGTFTSNGTNWISDRSGLPANSSASYTNKASAPTSGIARGVSAWFSSGDSGGGCMGSWNGSTWKKTHLPMDDVE